MLPIVLREEHVNDEEIEPRVRESLRFVEMEETMEKLPAELSGGMRRRVSIARALVSRPHVVLYDSPTAGLDPVTSQTIITLILRLRDTQGVTSMLATHRLQDAFGLANYRFDRDSGRVVHVKQNGDSLTAAAATNFVVLRGGKAYFEGNPQAMANSNDDVFQALFIVMCRDAEIFEEGTTMAQHKQLTWTELRVGLFVLAGVILLVGRDFLRDGRRQRWGRNTACMRTSSRGGLA